MAATTAAAATTATAVVITVAGAAGTAAATTAAESPGDSGARGLASGSSQAVAPKSTALPQEGQKRAVPGTALPQSGQGMIAAEYITARFQVQALEISGTACQPLRPFTTNSSIACEMGEVSSPSTTRTATPHTDCAPSIKPTGQSGHW
ncbi:MAG: hypothetical protein WB869_11955 [Candidatus Acidiferrales bacterium]